MNAPDEVLLRSWQPADATALSHCLNNINVLKELPGPFPFPYTTRHARVFIGMSNCTNSELTKAIEYRGEVVGGIFLVEKEDIWQKNAELRFFIGEPYWNRGIMQQALAHTTRYAFEQFDFKRIYALVFEENLSAMHLLKKGGFIEEGVLRNAAFRDEKLHNICVLSILNQ